MLYDKKTGYYYALFTRGSKLEFFRSLRVGNIITDCDSHVIYTKNLERDGICGHIWLPKCTEDATSDGISTQVEASLPMQVKKSLFIMQGPSDDPFTVK